MKITFLGTSSMQPTKERNLSSIHVSYMNENILFDCGEGTQRQMKIAGLKPTKLTRIIISHFHADHVLGLGGIIRYLQVNGYEKTLHIYGPKGLKVFFHNIINSAYYGGNVKIELHEIKSGNIINENKFLVEALSLDHSVQSYGFLFKESNKINLDLGYLKKFGLKQNPILKELQNGKDIVWNGHKISAKKAAKITKGKQLALIWDTAYCDNCIKLAEDTDLLICESTFSSKEENKAKDYKHLCTKDAAKIAKKAKAKKLILTHFSQRYKDTNELKKEAREIFKNTECAHDFMEVEI